MTKSKIKKIVVILLILAIGSSLGLGLMFLNLSGENDLDGPLVEIITLKNTTYNNEFINPQSNKYYL